MLICLVSECSVVGPLKGFWLVQLLVSAFLAILFVQSGLDKITDRKGNLEWLTGHFSRSFLSGSVPFLLGVITVFEVAAGVTSAIGVVEILLAKTYCLAFVGSLLSAVSLVMLFFGQRVAKDYAGAGGLVPYFILVVIDLYFLA